MAGQLGREQRELLEQDGALAPGAGLAHGPAVPVVRRGSLVGRGPAGQVGGGEGAGVALAAGVHGGPPGLPQEGLGDEPGAPDVPRRVDLRLPVPRSGGVGEQPFPGGGEGGVAEQLAGARRVSVRQVDLGRGRPLGLEQLPHGLDGLRETLHGRVSVLGVGDGVLQHVGQRFGAVVAQQEQPGVEGTGHGGGEWSGAGDEVQTQLLVVRDRRPGRCHSLSAQHPHLAARGGEQDRHLTGGPVEVRLDDVQHEGTGHGCVVGVAPVLQHRHGRLRGQPVGGRHHAEGSLKRGPGAEDASHLAVSACRKGRTGHQRARRVPGRIRGVRAGASPSAPPADYRPPQDDLSSTRPSG